MEKEVRTAVYDGGLGVEAYRLEGVTRPFPKHFHEYYVIGLVEQGRRVLSCKNREYAVQPGGVLLFNPGDSHACVQSGGDALDYRGLNIPKEVMLDLAGEGRREPPVFSQSVIADEEAARRLRSLHQRITRGSGASGKEESLLFLISLLTEKYSRPFEGRVPECREEVEEACAFIERHYAERIDLERICRRAGLSKSTLLRAFTKSKGVTPYGYLENIRVGRAKKLLERGVPPIEAALRTGFSDQSHFTHCFHRFTGLTPGVCRDIYKNPGAREERRRDIPPPVNTASE